ncbi:MAG: ABC transporter ATP-binding protein [Candidatus Methanofastidiosia archaeon]|jgi:putative ABC transport system ATP-binding protein
MSELLKTENLSKIFTMGKEKIYAARDITITIKKGEIFCLAGPSGSGKSTFLGLLGGLDRPTTGEIYFKGKKYSCLSEDALAELRRERIGFVFQFYNLLPVLSAFENVKLPLDLVNTPKVTAMERAWHLLEIMGVKERGNHRPSQLSGGEQQRIALARALANNPEIVLADEPTGNLDSKTGKRIMQLIQSLNEVHGQTFVIASHDKRIAKIAQRIGYMKDGGIYRVETGTQND